MNAAGFEELEHTADWSLRCWAPDLPGLFVQAARGMYALMELARPAAQPETRSLALEAADLEDLLVSFLSELLYMAEEEYLAFGQFDLLIDPPHLHATLTGAPFTSQRKEIKAVTYHNLVIQTTPRGYEVIIVFDV